jgi:hypothetical protein
MMRHGRAGGGPVVSKSFRCPRERVTHLVFCELVLELIQWSTYCDHCIAWRRSNTAMNEQFKEALPTSSPHGGVGYSLGRLRSNLRNPQIFPRVRGTYKASSSRPSSSSVHMLLPIAISRSRQP